MTKRKILIIKKASELFAENGFSATSVQDITDACGISKGSFYLSFKSKESLLFAIFEYFNNKLIAKMDSLYDVEVDARERFELFFSTQLEEIARYSDFILMQMREQKSPGNEEMFGLINELKQKTYEMQEKILVDVYGEKIREHMPDLLVLLSGIITGYIEIIIFSKELLDYKALSGYIVTRIDSLVNGLSEPFLKSHHLIGYQKIKGDDVAVTAEMLLHEIRLLKLCSKDENMYISLDVIEQELSAEDYRNPVVQGMISNLKTEPLAEVLLVRLKQFLEIARK